MKELVERILVEMIILVSIENPHHKPFLLSSLHLEQASLHLSHKLWFYFLNASNQAV